MPVGTLEVDGALTTPILNVTLSPSGTGTGAGQLAGSGTITLTADGLYYNSTATSRFAGTFKGAVPGLEVDSGTLILSGTNDLTGGTTVLGGELVLASNTAIADGSSLTIGAGGMLVFDPSQAVAGSVHLSQGEYYGCPGTGTEHDRAPSGRAGYGIRGLAEVWLST